MVAFATATGWGIGQSSVVADASNLGRQAVPAGTPTYQALPFLVSSEVDFIALFEIHPLLRLASN